VKPIPHRHHAAGKRKIRQRLDRPVTAPSPQPASTAPGIHYGVSSKARAIAPGGIGAIRLSVRKLGLAEAIDERLRLPKPRLPYHESDHVLNFADNALGNGTRLDDIELRRNDVALPGAPGADRIPDPTTAGGFCRRFSPDDVEALRDVFDQARVKVWKQRPSDSFDEAVLDVDGTPVAAGAGCKQGVDIAYDGTWGYRPLIVSSANTGEVLGIANRPGNRPWHEGAAEQPDPAVLLCRRAGFRRVYPRGDADFTRAERLDAREAEGVPFLFGIGATPDLEALAEGPPASDRVELRRPPQYIARGEPRRRPERVRGRIVRERGFETPTRLREAVAEVSYRPAACRESYRLIIIRQTIAVEEGRARPLDEIRHRFYLTDDRKGLPREVVFKGDGRCGRENPIAQLKGGVHALRAAADDLTSNRAYMVTTGPAWGLKAWLALSAPGSPRHKEAHRQQKRQPLRMEPKRFVNTIIPIPCRIARSGRRLIFRPLSWSPWQGAFLRVVPAPRC
jgi:hypothetical protein